MPRYKNINVFFPVWNYANYANPYKAAFKAIRKQHADEPELVELFTEQLVDMMQGEIRTLYDKLEAALVAIEATEAAEAASGQRL